MTNQEKMEKYNALTAELLKQQSIMRKSDEHAMKCQAGVGLREDIPGRLQGLRAGTRGLQQC